MASSLRNPFPCVAVICTSETAGREALAVGIPIKSYSVRSEIRVFEATKDLPPELHAEGWYCVAGSGYVAVCHSTTT
jgi:hypothetical protein